MVERIGSLVRQNDGITLHAEWAGLLNGDTGRAVAVGGATKIALQAKGTFGAGGTVTWQGSMDGTTWGAMGAGVTQTDSRIINLLERPEFIRPNVTAGDGTTNLTAMVVASEG